jgi:transmembrane protein
MPRWVSAVLESSVVSLVARVLLTLAFWSSGIDKILHWNNALGEMAHFHLDPPAAFALATIVVQLVGSALVIWGPYAWLGAGMLGVFTVLTIPVAHPVWALPPEQAAREMNVVVEHISLVGALILVSILRWREVAER